MKAIAKRNRTINGSIALPEGSISGQGQGSVSELRFGLYRMSYNGCGAIALYNALRMCGEQPDLRDIALALEPHLVLLGTFGVHPDGMGKAIHALSHPYLRLASYDEFTRALARHRVFILCFWTKRPWCSSSHFIAFERKSDGYEVHNLYNNILAPMKIADMTAVCSRRQFIRAYVLE
ncbi:MAG: hypothetical protein IKR73_09175 [Oscillospiraceae bacterium]|nr:hypothetical protein [Oscillospiraceae bacterium]